MHTPTTRCLISASWLVLYGSSYWTWLPRLAQNGHYSHIPLILLAVVWLLSRQRHAWTQLPDVPIGASAITLLALGLILAAMGQLLSTPLLIMGSQLPLLAGIIAWFKGTAGLKLLRFELGFMLWLIPLPAFWLEQLTQPLRNGLTSFACTLLQLADYPASSSGALLFIGPYRLFVEDACSGLHSIQTLCAAGMLYLYCQPSRRHTLLLMFSLLPLALIGNLLRILLLGLFTHHLGDLTTRSGHVWISAAIFIAICLLILRLHTTKGAHT